METHTVSHTRARLKGDLIVNNALNVSISRESEYTHKKSTVSEAEMTYTHALQENTIEGIIPTFTGDQAIQLKGKFDNKIKNCVKKSLITNDREKWRVHVKNLIVQGKFLALATAEKQDIVWKSYMFNLKQGTLKFLLNASIDTLPTAANLKRWKKSTSDLCKLCKQRETTNHILNSCPVSLEQGRYTWRHNSVINYIVQNVANNFKVYSDLPEHTAPGGGTIPPELCVTSQKPDIVIIDNHNKKLHIFELTCPSEEHIDTRNTEKSNKYAHFSTDITGYSCIVNCFEVSSKGYISTRNHTTLKTLHKFINPQITLSEFKKNISSISVMSSHFIFLCKSDPTFTEPQFILPIFHDTRGRTKTRTPGQ